MNLPMFIEVHSFPFEATKDNDVRVNLQNPETSCIPISWIGPFSKVSLTTEGSDKSLEVVQMTLQYGQKLIIKENYETVKAKINACLPNHLKKEDWESDDNDLIG